MSLAYNRLQHATSPDQQYTKPQHLFAVPQDSLCSVDLAATEHEHDLSKLNRESSLSSIDASGHSGGIVIESESTDISLQDQHSTHDFSDSENLSPNASFGTFDSLQNLSTDSYNSRGQRENFTRRRQHCLGVDDDSRSHGLRSE